MTRDRIELAATLTLLALPLVLFFYLLQNPALDPLIVVPLQHFYIVTAASVAALGLAVLLATVSVVSRQPRTFLTAAAFLAIAGIFSVHGLATPDVVVHEPYHAVLVSARLSLLTGGLLFALGAVDLPGPVARLIERHHGRLMAAAVGLVLVYIVANLVHHGLMDFVPVNALALQDGSAAVATACLLFAAWRYYQVFSISRVPSAAALSIGLVLLAEAQVNMALGSVWRLSWWQYHVLMLAGFLVPMVGFALEYSRGGSLRSIVEGLFLRDVLKNVERSLPDAVGALVAATEAKDPYLQGHARRVCEVSVRMAEELHLPDAQVRCIAAAALLHDVGKIGIPDAVLQKPGRLDEEEFAVLKGHTTRGFHIAAQVPSLGGRVAEIIRHHHERLDGSGYPDGLKGDEIPVEARIVAVADVWDALTSDRVYRKAWTHEAALDLLRQEAGVKLDGRCVEALLSVLERAEEVPPATGRVWSLPHEAA
jgi:HD-GYP domain-containing protein (c-di-GMP phosphodiesterase class II)